MRILGLDIGERRIGIALSDERGIIARGLETIMRDNDLIAVNEIYKLVEKYNVEKIVYGMPFDKDGKIGKQGEETLSFVSKLNSLKGVELVQWDERFSTKEATRALIEGNVRRKKRKALKDKVSAVIILQAYLDSIGTLGKREK
ncbi:MAG: Holliday junction resolvase RuvX [Candidatus Schekmanbacteria bacterium]|nr:MAG: Holliday junction resolvase RuvX [Candidatus Schekmanbacteria bacterium]